MEHLSALVCCPSYDQAQVDAALSRALSLTGGLDWVKKGMRIVIKPNLVMRKHPDTASTTHPAMLEALVKRLVALGAEVLIGDSPGGPFTEYLLKSVYEGTQMTQLEKIGAQLNYNTSVETVAYSPGKALTQMEIASFIIKADAVITFAKLKTHVFMGYSGAVKNLFGAVPGTIKFEYHHRFAEKEKFAHMIVDVAECVKPRLALIDAVIGMEGPGPTGGTPRFVGALIASTNMHHADLIGTSLMGLAAADIPTLSVAMERGLCPSSVTDIVVQGDSIESVRLSDFKTITPDYDAHRHIKVFNVKLMKKVFETRPVVDAQICIGCSECKRACPPKAIVMVNKLPQFDRKKCIRCFCCQELCPKTAILVHRTFLARAIEKIGK